MKKRICSNKDLFNWSKQGRFYCKHPAQAIHIFTRVESIIGTIVSTPKHVCEQIPKGSSMVYRNFPNIEIKANKQAYQCYASKEDMLGKKI